MRPRNLTISPYGAADADGIATSQTPAAGGIQAFTLDGAFATGGVATLDIPRQVQILGAADESARTYSVTGTNRKGNSITEALAGLAAGASRTVRAFKTVTEILIDDDSAGAIQIGTGTDVETDWLPLDYLQTPFEVGLGVVIQSGSATVNLIVELTLSNLLDYQGENPVPGRGQHVAGIGGDGQFSRSLQFIEPVDHDTLTAVSAAGVTSGNIAFPVRAVRLRSVAVFTSPNGPVELQVVQAHHGP